LDENEIGTYDAVYSIGMLEHVGYQNHGAFFECVKKLLKPSGLAVIQTIGEPDFVPIMDPFLDKYIFPGAVIPTLSSLTSAFENHFILEDFQNFGYDYALTLNEWDKRSKQYFKENPGAYYRCEACGDLKPEERQSRLEMRARDGVIGRGGGFVERQGAEVRKEHNSDDEEIDDFGRPKKRASGAAGAAARRAAALARLQNKRAAGTGRRATRSRSR